MSDITIVLRGRVANGVVVLDPGAALPDGTEVTVTPAPAATPVGMPPTGYPPGVEPFNPEEQAEFDAWEKMGDEAWAMIDEWEKEERDRETG